MGIYDIYLIECVLCMFHTVSPEIPSIRWLKSKATTIKGSHSLVHVQNA